MRKNKNLKLTEEQLELLSDVITALYKTQTTIEVLTGGSVKHVLQKQIEVISELVWGKDDY